MTHFAINLLLAAVWVLLRGLTLGELALGLLVGFAVLVVSRPFIGSGGYVDAVQASLTLAAVFAAELVRANLRLARDVTRHHPRFHQAVLGVDVSALGPGKTAFLSALVSLTPGSVTVDLTNGRVLYFHTVYAHDPERARAQVRRMAELIARATGGTRRAPGQEGGH